MAFLRGQLLITEAWDLLWKASSELCTGWILCRGPGQGTKEESPLAPGA